MASLYDDQFDFDDLEPKKAAKKPKQQKKNKKNDDDFFDLDDEEPPKISKLPIINQKTKDNPNLIIPKEPASKNSKKAYDDYQEIYEQVKQLVSPKKNNSKKGTQKSDYYEQLQQENTTKPVEAKKLAIKDPPKPVKLQEQDQQFYESLDENKSPKQANKVLPQISKNHIQLVQKQDSVYQEQDFDQYNQDFEEIQDKPNQILPKKSQTTANLKSKDRNSKQLEKPKIEERKLVINTNKVFTNKQQKDIKSNHPIIPKPPQKENSSRAPSKKQIQPQSVPNGGNKQATLQKSSSKRSLQSVDSKKNLSNSKVSSKRRTIQISTNRHIELVERSFPQTQEKVSEYNNDKLSRLNEQVRQMIRKFNQELNDLINKNMILLKDKPIQRQSNPDDKVRILQEQLRSGGTALEVIQNELDRLKGRQGELREEQYQLIMEKKIEDIKELIKQTTKTITKLKFDVNNEGNKLSKHEVQKKMAQELHQIKLMLMQMKKEQQKNQIKWQKVEKMAEQLQSKNADKDYELSQQIDNAKDKGVSLNISGLTRKRYDELKLKTIAIQNHKRCMESLNKTKCDHIIHQCDQIRNTCKNVQSQIANFHQSIEHSQDQSIKLIKKAKQNPKINAILTDNLDKILKSIEQNQAINFYEVRTQGNNSQASERPLKNSMYENVSKQKPPMRTSSSKKQPNSANKQKGVEASPPNDEINLMKPNFMKKKEKNESPNTEQSKEKQNEQRIWSEQEQKKKQQQKRKQEEERKKIQEERRKQAQIALEEQKKKPFNLKKNRMSSENKEKSMQQSPQIKMEIQLPKEIIIQTKQQQKPSLGPKFLRLNKKQKNPQGSKNDIAVEKSAQQIKKNHQQPLKMQAKANEQDQPMFIPKRLNLRNKIQKKDDSYVPTIEKNNEIKEKKQEYKQVKKEYAPNFSFKDEQPFKAPAIEGKKIENDIKIEINQDKPKFNLRLRDRQKKQTNQADYVPTRLTQVAETKPKIQSNGYNPFDKPITNVEAKKDEQKSYIPTLKPKIPEKQIKIEVNKQAQNIAPVSNPYAQINNPYTQASNPYAQAQKDQIVNNPYLPKQQPAKRQRQGPLKKNKLLNKGPKEKINIYDQVEDITQPAVHIPVSQPPKQQQAKTDELDLNAMLGIKKKDKANDLDDLLGDIKVDKKKEKKKNNDFFNDLEL